MTIRFLVDKGLWGEIQRRAINSRRARVAVAYFGKGGAVLLPLSQGDKLVVDLSLAAVRQGVTDPREIKKLIDRGVSVFSCRSLHMKIFIFDRTLIVGSANVSNNSFSVLREAGVATTDPAALRRAESLFEQLCGEPVRQKYLDQCIDEYRPPKFKPAADRRRKTTRARKALEPARLWFIAGLRYFDLPKSERGHWVAVTDKAKRQLRQERTEVDCFHFSNKPSWFDLVRPGDWVVACFHADGGGREVWAPQQVLSSESYARGRGKRRYLLVMEMAVGAETMSLSEFRRKVGRGMPGLAAKNPRTQPIRDEVVADKILRLWKPSGRLRSE